MKQIDAAKIAGHPDYKKFHSTVVMHDDMLFALKEFSNCLVRAQTTQESCGLMLTGESGAGKTTTLESFKEHARQNDLKFAYISLESDLTIKSLCGELIETIRPDYKMTQTQTALERTKIFLKLVEIHQIDVLIMDEFQHVLLSKTKRTAEKTSEWVKSLLNATKGLVVVISGMPTIEEVFQLDDSALQLKRRIHSTINLSKYAALKDTSQKRVAFLKKYLSHFNTNTDVLLETNQVNRILNESGNNIGKITKIVEFCVSMALTEGRTKVILEDLNFAIERLNG
ncbi:ATP-binding protein [Thiomicrorhabdus cannonii]|uniref:ATP-binding protein n=1 Tax=Thiomicrorhabdus cannonii TaxID=2748011 RepID=UPI0015BEE0D5|nr:ATP-binding protein [Thiomicrorhabdus cannonii]